MRYSAAFKQEIVDKMLPPNNISVASLSQEFQISASTLYSWRKKAIGGGLDGIDYELAKSVMDYIVAFSNLYGMVHKKIVLRIYNQQNEEPIEIELLDMMLANLPEYLVKKYVYSYRDYFVNEAIFMFGEMQLMLNQKGDKPYYIPEKQELLKYVDEYYFEKTHHFKQFLTGLKQIFPKESGSRVMDLAEEIQGLASMDSDLDGLMESFDRLGFQILDEKNARKIVSLVVNLANHTRRWSNNGHTPKELSRQRSNISILENPLKNTSNMHAEDTRKEIGRNDPCYCGSGKKYKKCCLGKN
ncbi:SEC-C metal-binding domain-containing protein [Enterococcus eurekensis]|uniref:SEC-C metal-binding domain-containing protein n=1 Tax=Enterococcus eurekensis TaxID=1159753 RepID=A0ABV9M5R4_9ENTE